MAPGPRSGWRCPCWGSVLAVVLLVFTGVVTSLRDARVEIPRAVLRHKDATLRCLYDMEGEELYSIKWYRGQQEFFRYTPKENPKAKVFGVEHINVVMEKSNRSQVTLRRVDVQAAGRYACEVSADRPSFTTSMVEGRLNVVEVPRHIPDLVGLKARYHIGEFLRANCSTEFSIPAANLSVQINGNEFVGRERVKYYRMEYDEEGRQRPKIGVTIKLLPEHFGPDNKLKIRCQADIYDVYHKSNERSVELRSSYRDPPSVLETNQPPNDPYDQDAYGYDSNGKRRYPGDPSAAARPEALLQLLPLYAGVAVAQSVWR